MFSELIFIVLAFFVLLLIDKFSTLFALITCVVIVYCYVYNFSYVLNKRVVVLAITKIWAVLLYCFRIGKQVFCLFERLFLTTKCHIPPPSHSNAQFCGDVACFENEVNALVLNISQYYINSWYQKISPNEEFSNYLNSSINETLVRLCASISKVDKKKFSYIILQIYLNFFSHFVDAKKKSEVDKKDLFEVCKKENFEMKHWAMKDNLTEWCYLQSLVSALLDSFCPSEYDRSLHSKHSPLLHTLVVEILTENIIHPLVNVLCDPLYLNRILLKLLLNCVKTNEKMSISLDNNCSHKNISTPNPEECFVNQPVILLPNEDSSEDQVLENYEKTETLNRLSVPDDCCQIKNSSLDHSIKRYKRLTEDFPCFVSSGIKSSSNINLYNHDFSDSKIPEFNSCSSTASEATIKRSRSADYIRQMPQLKALNEKDYSIVLQSENNKMLVAVKSDGSSGSSIEQAEEAIEVEVPTLFTNVQIVNTFQNEDALLPYTLYCIQYTGIFHDTGKSSDVPHFVKQVVSIKRRFREFLALHSQLEDNPSLKTYLKGIKGPSKGLVLPFSNLDKKNIAERRSFLENYLKDLCSTAAIAQSSELQEFLAYGGGERMSFVRKPTDVSVPRIDKMLVRGVKGAFDIIRTALPNSPLDEENTSRPTFEDNVPDQKFQEHLLDYSSREPEIKEHISNFLENSSFKLTPDDIRSSESIFKKESLVRNTHFTVSESCECSVLCADSFLQEENPFGNTIIELIAVALQLDETNLGYLFSIFKILFAPCINRYVVDHLDKISDEHLTVVLHLLHKFLWPDKDKENSSVEHSNLQNDSIPSKIMDCFEVLLTEKGVIHNLKITVLEKINLFLSSIQHEEANRCLLFHMFDVVIETLCFGET